MDTLIVGIDGSEESRDALRLGQALAAAGNAELHVASVIPFDIWLVKDPAYERGRMVEFDERFLAADETLNSYVAHRLDSYATAGALADLAREIEADAIIVGSTGDGLCDRVVIGNTGEDLAMGAPCSVIVAPGGFGASDQTTFERIGVAFNDTPESQLALEAAAPLSRDLNASLALIGVIRPPSPAFLFGIEPSDLVDYKTTQMREALEEAAATTDAIKVDPLLLKGRAANELMVESRSLDLLVMGSRGWGPLRSALLGATSGKVMRGAHCPVMVVPRGDRTERSHPRDQRRVVETTGT